MQTINAYCKKLILEKLHKKLSSKYILSLSEQKYLEDQGIFLPDLSRHPDMCNKCDHR